MDKFYFETPNIIIRNFQPSDAKEVALYSQQPNVSYWLSDMVLKSEEEASSWINWIESKNNVNIPFIVLAIVLKTEQKCIGLIGVHPKEEINHEIEILYGISDDYQRNGYATEAAKVLIDFVFTHTPIHFLSAIVKPENISSCHVVNKLGFIYLDTRTLPYDGELCSFNYYRLAKKETQA